MEYVQITNSGQVVATQEIQSRKFSTPTNPQIFAMMGAENSISAHGLSQLQNGLGIVLFPREFVEYSQHPRLVFTTPWGDSNPINLIGMSEMGFVVKEAQQGSSNAHFNWLAIAPRRNDPGGTYYDFNSATKPT